MASILNQTPRTRGLQLDPEAVREYMRSEKLRPGQLADRMGISYNMLYLVLKGERGAGQTFIAGLLTACPGATFEQFFTVIGEEQEA